MENKPTMPPRNSGEGPVATTIEARFVQLCKSVEQNGLCMDENTLSQATRLFTESNDIIFVNTFSVFFSMHQQYEAERYWFAFLLYSVKKLGAREAAHNSNHGFSLCRILRLANLNLADFFKQLDRFIVKLGPFLCNLYGADWEKRLEAKELQASFVHLNLLSKYYKCAYQEFFLTSEAALDNQFAAADLKNHLSGYYRFGWLLFLALRMHVFNRSKDLVTCTNGLVSILAILIIHLPIRVRNFNINQSPWFVKKGNKVDLVASLCNIYETSEDELRKTLDTTNHLIKDLLRKNPRMASECTAGNIDNIDPDGLIYFEDLMEESSLSSSLSILEKDYDDSLCNKGELDERIFVDEEDSLVVLESLSGGSMCVGLAKWKFDCNLTTAATPVTAALTTSNWLRTIIVPFSSKPSLELQKFLLLSDRDITADVICRAHIVLERIFPSSGPGEHCATGSLQSTSLMDNIKAEQRRSEALMLYYRVLQAVCMEKYQILNANLTSLLSSERFHRCMLACSAMLVLATHKLTSMLFPAVLERTGITTFDFSKAVEIFIRHEGSLPRLSRRHLNSLEEQLLESGVWEKGSSMYNCLTVARPSLSAEINRLGMLAEPIPCLDAISMHIDMSSPPTRPNQGGGVTSAQTALHVLFAKIVKLAGFRIGRMAEQLKLPQQIRESIYCLFQKMLYQRTTVFFNRHIDQIILCCFYVAEKRFQLNLTINKIISSYLKQPQSKSEIFCSVFVDRSAGRVDGETQPDRVHICTFYNKIFRTAVKPLLVELALVAVAQRINHAAVARSYGDVPCPASSQTSSFPSSRHMSPEKASVAHYSHVSPLGQSKIVNQAAVRIKGMVELLKLPQQIGESVCVLFQKILSQRTTLFSNCHIDQAVLCCFCGVAKISKLNLTLEEIVYSYLKQPQSRTEMLSSFFVERRPDEKTQPDGIDVITFYNEVFIPAVKPLLLEFAPVGAAQKNNRSAVAMSDNDEQLFSATRAQCRASQLEVVPDLTLDDALSRIHLQSK